MYLLFLCFFLLHVRHYFHNCFSKVLSLLSHLWKLSPPLKHPYILYTLHLNQSSPVLSVLFSLVSLTLRFQGVDQNLLTSTPTFPSVLLGIVRRRLGTRRIEMGSFPVTRCRVDISNLKEKILIHKIFNSSEKFVFTSLT